jgi:hypothetical protein
MHEEGFYRPPDWRLVMLEPPSSWYNAVMQTLYAAIEATLPAA